MRPTLHYLATPPTRWFHTAITVVALAVCHHSIFLGRASFFYLFALFWIILAVGGWWVFRLVLYGLMLAFDRDHFVFSGRSALRWLVAPAICLLTVLLITAKIPFKVAFALSRPAMTRLAQDVYQQKVKQPVPDQRVGFYYAFNIRKIGRGVYFRVADGGLLDEDYLGFAYSPEAQPKAGALLNQRSTPTFESLGHGWYVTNEYIRF